jgi:hypothetical protein
MDGQQMPPPDTPVMDGPLGYHIHTGKHAITRYDWLQYIRFADTYLKNGNSGQGNSDFL